jgi:hypothetical protein
VKLILFAAALLVACAHLARAVIDPTQVAVLHIQVTEGEGAVNTAGAHNARPLTVEVTDETGKPVEGASVSFHLPEDGASGTFGSGLRTDVTSTDSSGHANLHTMLLNRIPGRFTIRIVVSKEQARAGMVTFEYIAEPKGGAAAASSSTKSAPSFLHGPLKWVAIAVLAGGAVAAGALLAGKSGNGASSTGATATSTSTISIGAPSITVGKP